MESAEGQNMAMVVGPPLRATAARNSTGQRGVEPLQHTTIKELSIHERGISCSPTAASARLATEPKPNTAVFLLLRSGWPEKWLLNCCCGSGSVLPIKRHKTSYCKCTLTILNHGLQARENQSHKKSINSMRERARTHPAIVVFFVQVLVEAQRRALLLRRDASQVQFSRARFRLVRSAGPEACNHQSDGMEE